MTQVDPELKAAHEKELGEVADAYRQAKARADQIMSEPRQRLAEAVRAAYGDNVRKSEILKATDHVWSRQWIDQTVKPEGGRTQ
jgi:hypothetical protein